MKKIRVLVMVLLATVAVDFMGCVVGDDEYTPGSEYSDGPSSYTYTGTVKVKIFNNADVPLTINSITECLCDSESPAGTYGQESSISAGESKEFEISCSATSNDYRNFFVYYAKFDCYCTSGSSILIPYAGSIEGTSIEILNNTHADLKTSDTKLLHERLDLWDTRSDTITTIYNFVKNSKGVYVLCTVY